MRLAFLIWVYCIVAWVVNLATFFKQDFEPVGKKEVIHGIGVFIPPTAAVTVWY